MNDRKTPPGGVRVIHDDAGTTWMLREVERHSENGAWWALQFSAGSMMRTVRNFPPEWYAWDDPALLTLLATAADDR